MQRFAINDKGKSRRQSANLGEMAIRYSITRVVWAYVLATVYYAPASIRWSKKRWWLSSVYVPDRKSRMEGRSKLKIGRKEAHDTGDPWPHLVVERSKVKVIRSCRQSDACLCIIQQQEVAETLKLAERLCNSWNSTPLPGSKGQRSRSPGHSGWLFKSPVACSRSIL